MKKLKMKTRIKEMFRFAVTGGVSFIVDFGLLVLLVELFSMNELLAAGISFTVSVVLNYIMCVAWVFDAADKKNVLTIAIFIGSSVIGLALNELFMWLFIYVFNINYMISKVLSTILVMIWNYIAKRRAVLLQNPPNK